MSVDKCPAKASFQIKSLFINVLIFIKSAYAALSAVEDIVKIFSATIDYIKRNCCGNYLGGIYGKRREKLFWGADISGGILLLSPAAPDKEASVDFPRLRN